MAAPRLRLHILVGTGLAAGLLAAGAEGQPRQGRAFKDCDQCPEMVVVPAGSFIMGSPPGEPLRDPDELQHKVTFTRPFAISRHIITWAQWEACVADNFCEGQAVETALRTDLQGKAIANYKDHGRGNRPVVGISWWDAQRFVGWMNMKAGGGYRLVTEAEFEYATRAGTTSAYYWGDKPDHDFANFGRIAGGLGGETGGRDVWLNDTSPVGSFPPNAWGLYDMLGNTYQWTADCYEADASKLPADGSAVTSGNCNVRVMRSTSFTSEPHTLRSANRAGQYPPNLRGRNYLSFRVAKTLR